MIRQSRQKLPLFLVSQAVLKLDNTVDVLDRRAQMFELGRSMYIKKIHSACWVIVGFVVVVWLVGLVFFCLLAFLFHLLFVWFVCLCALRRSVLSF